MKKTICLILVLSSLQAQASHTALWAAIGQIGSQISNLRAAIVQMDARISSLGAEINHLPKPIYYQAGAGIEISGAIIKATLMNQHVIGEEYRGGLVFFVDETGQHGLIASKADVNGAGVQWRNGASGNKVTNAQGDGIGAGETNTRLIIAEQTIDNQKGEFAALQAANFQVLADGYTACKTPIATDLICYGGWYLPSAFELQLMHRNLQESNLSSFAPEYYWSSTESSATSAWLINFSNGEITASSKSNTVGRVRPITRF